MHFARIQLLLIMVLLSAIQSGICIKCYRCQSQGDPACGEPFKSNNIEIVDCHNENTRCLKVKRYTEGGGVEPIIRDCYDESYCTNLNVCLECKKDLCNSSRRIGPSFILGIVAAAVGIKYYLLGIFRS